MATLYPRHLKHEWQPRRQAIQKKRLIKWRNDYNRKYYKKFLCCIDNRTETDIIAWLETNKPYNTAIKRLIREQIERESHSTENN